MREVQKDDDTFFYVNYECRHPKIYIFSSFQPEQMTHFNPNQRQLYDWIVAPSSEKEQESNERSKVSDYPLRHFW